MALFEETLTDTTSVGFNVAAPWGAGLSVTITTTELLSVVQDAGASDVMVVLDRLLDPQRSFPMVLGEAITITPEAAEAYGQLIYESLRITPQGEPTTTFQLTVAQAVSIVEAAAAGEAVTLSDAAIVAAVASAAMGAHVAESLNLAIAADPSTTYSKVLTDSILLTDALRRFLSGDVLDGVTMTSSPLPLMRSNPVLGDNVTVTPELAPKLIMRMVLQDETVLTATELLQLIYTQNLSDVVELTAAYLSPGEALTTWAINTVNGATTEYENFDFNSMAQVGGRYFGARSDGLYELVGDSDDGTDIIAQIKSGLLQMTEARFTQFRAAYLASHSDAEGAQLFTLKLVTGDGTERIYAVTVRDNETTKIHLGKGIRARYISFELTSTGQDFDLDTLEFVPITASRRV